MKISKIEKIDDFDDEYVYDVTVDDETPYFFANGILVHNSCYVTLADLVKQLDTYDPKFEEVVEDKDGNFFDSVSDWIENAGNPSYTPTVDREGFKKFIDEVVELADALGEAINDSFPSKMVEMFFVTEEQGAIIKAGREVVGRRGLFKDAKKRYAISVIDNEGLRVKKIKVVGMDTQRSDTPKWIQKFLKDTIELVVLIGVGAEVLRDHIEKFRREVFDKKQPWELGRPCRVSNLTAGEMIRQQYNEGRLDKKPTVHFSVTAAANTNQYLEFFEERFMDRIRDGDKIEILPLKKDTVKNPLGFDTVAIPVGINMIPDWFKDLPIDVKTAEKKLIDDKIDNVFGFLGWDLEPKKTSADDIFSF